MSFKKFKSCKNIYCQVSVGDEAAQLQTNDNWSPGDEWYSPGDRAQPLFPNFVRDG